MEKYIRVGDPKKIISQIYQEGCTYDFVWVSNVLEHVINPIETLVEINKILAKKGVLVITVPNDFSNLQDILYKQGVLSREYWVVPPEHLNYFNKESLKNIAELLNLKYIKSLGDFPIEWFLLNENSNYIKNKNIGLNAHLA